MPCTIWCGVFCGVKSFSLWTVLLIILKLFGAWQPQLGVIGSDKFIIWACENLTFSNVSSQAQFFNMSIQQTTHRDKKQSDLEKRLKLLRTQVYGKEFRVNSSELVVKNAGSTNSELRTNNSDLSYLYQDLLKIGIFSTLALGLQIILFMLTKNHILNINLFWEEVN